MNLEVDSKDRRQDDGTNDATRSKHNVSAASYAMHCLWRHKNDFWRLVKL